MERLGALGIASGLFLFAGLLFCLCLLGFLASLSDERWAERIDRRK
ncbi:hypothetical protein [Actinomadura algeriensis]|uniref:Uncharacterized protein n=1 Tax=Actinomadura algeriensis TaxID=1679523 RepID=A0ABR9K409_9ACTN|nr:hypothetical protein [Actinomadura algeriensis]MBE1537333.1 hypothetical protein [Actinomadura algeriensis]